ncbi:putative Ovochymase-2 [Hypsibius exemplaris]|uniref:Ovochymase-2 n=1 Tax=Hypsibius exemplaris TaxID=2072580 RepID=A0A9X6NF40_HYPEX|nr:putative Ovochymase-2 [Hypsibius exemplaris]
MLGWICLTALLAVASAQDGCKVPATLTGNTGTFFSPYYYHYPDFTYPNNARCRWTITVPVGQNVRFTFNDTASFESCNYDYVAIWPSGRGVNPCTSPSSQALAGPFCPRDGSLVPAPFVLSGNSFDVEFCTDSSQAYQGFELTYTATTEPGATRPPTVPTTVAITVPATTRGPVVCGGNLNLTATGPVTIESPYYPGQYTDNLLCTWTITSPAGPDNRCFAAEAFNTEQGYDFFIVTDISGPTPSEVASVSGTVFPTRVRSNGNIVRVVFRTDVSGVRTGFRVHINSYIPRCSVGDFECPYARPGDPETCFQPSKLCDGNVDCPGGADEHCPTGCGTPVNKPILSTKTGERIVGGIDARPHSWPWQISMLSNGRHNCGGSIIDHHWVVTAAHCCTSGPSTYKVRVGEHDIQDGQGEVNAWTYDVERVIQHPLYRSREQHDDICLLKTVLPIFFNDDVVPPSAWLWEPLPRLALGLFHTAGGSHIQVNFPSRLGEKAKQRCCGRSEDKQDAF